MQQFFPLSPKTFFYLTHKLAAGLLLACFWGNPVLAETIIKRGKIYRVRNQVDVNRYNRPNWNQAKLGQAIVPQDSVRTGANSRADILFNEGTLVRTGAGTTFRFPPGKRSFELTSGAALIMIRPEQGQSTITTPEAKVVSQGTALFVQHNTQTQASLVGVLTESAAGLVEVSNANGDVTIQLQAGEFVSVVRGVVGLVEHFVLPMFYETVELAVGLGTGQEQFIVKEPEEVQATIRAVQAEAINPLKNQLAWIEGFCNVNIKPEDLSGFLQLLGTTTNPGIKIILESSAADLAIIPFRSIGGLAWLSNYCEATRPNVEANPDRQPR